MINTYRNYKNVFYALLLIAYSSYSHSNDLAAAKSLFQFSRVTEIALTEGPKGNSDAQLELYHAYRFGRGVDMDSQLALKWLYTAAKNNNPEAYWYLAYEAKSGNIPPSYGTYESLINRSKDIHFDRAHNGDTKSMLSLLSMSNEFKIPHSAIEDLDQLLLKTLQERITANDIKAIEEYGHYILFTRERITKKIPQPSLLSQAVSNLTLAASQGSHVAMMLLSDFYKDSNPTKSKDYLTNAALVGDTSAIDGLAQAFWTGRFGYGTSNPEEAVKWFNQSARFGSSWAHLYLGYAYWEGRGVEKNVEFAIRNWTEAARFEPRANYLIGKAYIEGLNGLPRNRQVGIEYIQKSAQSLFPRAHQYLANLYFTGDFFIKNIALGREHLTTAATRNDIKSQVSLSKAYFNGDFHFRNLKAAYFWSLIASSWAPNPLYFSYIDMPSYTNDDMSQVQIARQLRSTIEKSLNTQDIQEVQRIATGWKTWQAEPIFAANSPTTLENQSTKTPSRPGSSSPRQMIRPDVENNGIGSGFKVSHKLTITNSHVIRGCNSVFVNGLPATILKVDTRSDLALLATTNLPGSVASIRRSSVRVGESVSAAGYPLRGLLSGFNITQGNVSSLSGLIGNQTNIQITTPVQPGNSGGPLLDSNGDVIGVIVSKLRWQTINITGTLPENINFAVSLDELIKFLTGHPITFASSSNQKMDLADIAEKARDFTTIISCR